MSGNSSIGRTRALALSFGSAALLASGVMTALHAQSARQASANARANTVNPAAIAPLVETQNAFAAVAQQVTPAVVSIHIEGTRPASQRMEMPDMPDLRQFGLPDMGGSPFGGRGSRGQRQDQTIRASGSGFIVSPDGIILTNNHVVADANKVTVILSDRREFDAKVIGRDPTTDVAVIKIDGKNLPTVPLGNDETARVGDWVLAIGNPLGLDFTVTQGIISAKGRGLAGLYDTPYAVVDNLQTDAPINPGNSGGPLVNVRGEVVGMNSAIASPTGSYAGYGFAIPVTLVRDVMNQIVQYGHVSRGILGLQLTEVTQKDAQTDKLAQGGVAQIRGALVADYPQEGASPARNAGIQKGDIIVNANGHDIDHVATLQRVIRSQRPGDVVSLTLVRQGAEKTVQVKLAAPGEETPKLAAR
ncbi:MAG TPA: trypsin-like peptidase domain-containing protein [Gemmatimonadaceae bacterium]|nr:trypsin-like peptidase domain-containing protein [Gemmatimonadaceae bacterium]